MAFIQVRRCYGASGLFQFFGVVSLKAHHQKPLKSTCELADDVVEWIHWL